jgi:hypothetical protein
MNDSSARRTITRSGGVLRDPASCLWALYHRGAQKDLGRYLGSRGRRGKDGAEETGVHVFARVFVMELMASSGTTGGIIPAERRQGKKLWFRVRRGSTRDRISEGRRAKGVWFIGDYGGDIGTYAFCLPVP